jgi:hypothetical protein
MSDTKRKMKKPKHTSRKLTVPCQFKDDEIDTLEELSNKHYFGNNSLAIRESVKLASIHKNKKGVK